MVTDKNRMVFINYPCGFYSGCGFTKNTHDVSITPMCTIWHHSIHQSILEIDANARLNRNCHLKKMERKRSYLENPLLVC